MDSRSALIPLLGIVLRLGCATSPPRTSTATLPELKGPIVGDARSAPEAWTGASVIDSGNEVTIRLGRLGDAIALRTETAGPSIATVLVAAGSHVWLLHASAALGTGEYRCQGDGRCSRVRDFEWTCRDPSQLPEAVACREAFRNREGWVGNVDPEAGRIREFRISPERFASGGELRLVVTILTLPDRVMSWPAIADDSASLAVQQGALPGEARFEVGRWFEVPRRNPATSSSDTAASGLGLRAKRSRWRPP